MKTIRIHTDGACSGNQHAENSGGWGTILEYQGTEKELYGGEINTTNNRMELTALLEGLKALKAQTLAIEVYSDSAYVINCFTQGWYKTWRMNGWRNSKKEPVENQDLWEPIIELAESFSQIRFFAIKGHLNFSKPAEIQTWYKKFQEKNHSTLGLDEFKEIVGFNHRVDELACKGAAECRK